MDWRAEGHFSLCTDIHVLHKQEIKLIPLILLYTCMFFFVENIDLIKHIVQANRWTLVQLQSQGHVPARLQAHLHN